MLVDDGEEVSGFKVLGYIKLVRYSFFKVTCLIFQRNVRSKI